MIICGVDPGQAGGIATIANGRASAWKMPETEVDTIELLRLVLGADTIVYMESVHSFPGQGVASSFTFGKGYGFLRGTVCTLGIPLIDVSPMRWKKALGINFTAQDSKKDKKNGSKALAQQWWPDIKINHAISEALLIARYGEMQQKYV